jgi:hypothetical protein
MNRFLITLLRKFDEVFDDFNDKKISKTQMLDRCKVLYKKLPQSWKTEKKKESRVI